MIRLLTARVWRRLYQTPTLLTILVGLVLVTYQFVIGSLPQTLQVGFCAFMLAVAGIPHGALDHLVEHERSIRLHKPFSFRRFIAKYLLTMGLYALAWLFAPVPCLLVFLLISAWHFGETDLNNAPQTPYWLIARLAAGGFVLGFILLTHADETSPILSRIVQADAQVMQVWQFAADRAGAVLRGWATLILVLTMLAYSHHPISLNGARIMRLLTILLLAYFLPLLPSFMLYFGGWHALSSFATLQNFLPVNNQKPYGALKHIWVKSLPLTLLSIFFLLLFTVSWQTIYPDFDPLPLLFIFLSLITLPHIEVMYGIDNNLNN
ncbi:Brp/Blh family beta-carotene 15,15'-dioxygenase [Rudanella lutea]|uniref:Brp/Blh family beta-carotene 15,15'-dioxygenase n=1 Tax=Rudanella lutea TaxID=451374 RepID=UPI00035C3BAA|nr:Brp/Blh family beta-carotene 15,15'-dioxygenase [Rudanella lutea]